MRRDIYAPDRATLSDNLYLAKNSRRRRPEVLVAAEDQDLGLLMIVSLASDPLILRFSTTSC